MADGPAGSQNPGIEGDAGLELAEGLADQVPGDAPVWARVGCLRSIIVTLFGLTLIIGIAALVARAVAEDRPAGLSDVDPEDLGQTGLVLPRSGEWDIENFSFGLACLGGDSSGSTIPLGGPVQINSVERGTITVLDDGEALRAEGFQDGTVPLDFQLVRPAEGDDSNRARYRTLVDLPGVSFIMDMEFDASDHFIASIFSVDVDGRPDTAIVCAVDRMIEGRFATGPPPTDPPATTQPPSDTPQWFPPDVAVPPETRTILDDPDAPLLRANVVDTAAADVIEHFRSQARGASLPILEEGADAAGQTLHIRFGCVEDVPFYSVEVRDLGNDDSELVVSSDPSLCDDY